jgi:hypothetical protein
MTNPVFERMNPRHLTLATIATLLTIAGSVYGGVTTAKKYVDDRQAENLKQAIEHERHDYELDRRLDRIELAIHMSVMNDSQKQRDLINQVLSVQNQLQAVKQGQRNIKQAIGMDPVSADAPSADPPPQQ